jgi:hypothetical protein
MRTTGLLLVTLLLCSCFCARPERALAAHKFYASLARVEYNDESKTLEVAMRVFADDLELALTRRSGRKVYLDKTKNAAELALAYLRETFEVRGRDGRKVELKWVGMETQGDVAWLYFEASLPEGLAGASMRDRVLIDLFSMQVNLVNLKYGGRNLDLVFRRGDDDPRRIP